MNFKDWYTDTMDVWRVEDKTVGSLTKHERVCVVEKTPCRVYQAGKGPVYMKDTAATASSADKLMCGLGTEIQTGDELLVYRGGKGEPIRYFAGVFRAYTEPFGAVLPGLAHQEGTISEEERT